MYRSSSKESYGEIMAEEVYIANGSHPSTRIFTDLMFFLFLLL